MPLSFPGRLEGVIAGVRRRCSQQLHRSLDAGSLDNLSLSWPLSVYLITRIAQARREVNGYFDAGCYTKFDHRSQMIRIRQIHANFDRDFVTDTVLKG